MMKPWQFIMFHVLAYAIIIGFAFYVGHSNRTEYVKTDECSKAYVKCYCPPAHSIGQSVKPVCKPTCVK